MIMHIDDRHTVGDLQERFSKCFPLLKIELFSIPHRIRKGSATRFLNPSERIEAIRTNHEHGILEIKSWYLTGKVEKDLKEKFGLNVHIYRRGTSGWIQTVATDNRTLKEQFDLAAGSMASQVTNIV